VIFTLRRKDTGVLQSNITSKEVIAAKAAVVTAHMALTKKPILSPKMDRKGRTYKKCIYTTHHRVDIRYP
jgi:hypothetical protein